MCLFESDCRIWKHAQDEELIMDSTEADTIGHTMK